MYKEERFIHRIFSIDTNRINSRSKIPAMNQLEQWHENGVIQIDMPEVAQKEAMAGLDPRRVEKAREYIYSITLANTREEQELLHKIEALLFPQGIKNLNQRNDAEIVFNASKYGSYLITSDGASKSQPGGILGHKDELKTLGITVMSDIEAVEYVKDLIIKRDQRAVRDCKQSGEPIPDWVSKD